jgi:phage terminase small subunit
VWIVAVKTGQAAGVARVKAGTSKVAAAERRELFKQAYLANNHNATKAAITAGFSPQTAYSAGQRLLKDVELSGELAIAAQAVAEAAGIEPKRVLEEARRLSLSDPANLYNADGTLKNIHDMDAVTRASIASIDMDGEGRPTKIKLWDKNAALEKLMRHLGLYKEDNAQQQESLVLRVETAVPVSSR